MTQLIFDLPHRAALNRDDFIVAPCNAEAVALVDGWAQTSLPPHLLYGEHGCGKSHLAAVLATQPDTLLVSAKNLTNIEALLASASLIIDDLDTLPSTEEETLFHLLNAAYNSQGNKKILLLAARPPAQLTITLPDLASRLRAIPGIPMRAPDDKLLAALLAKLFRDRQLVPDEKIISYLLVRCQRDYQSLAKLVARIDKEALATKRAITIPFLSDLLMEK